MAEVQKTAEEVAAAAAPAAPAPTITKTDPPAPVEDPEKQRLLKENADLRFDKELGDVGKTYPKASEYADKIKEKVAKGYSTTDAALIVLHENNALQVAAAAPAPADRSANLGGTMVTPPARDVKAPEPGTPEAIDYYTKQFKDLEAKGEIRIT